MHKENINESLLERIPYINGQRNPLFKDINYHTLENLNNTSQKRSKSPYKDQRNKDNFQQGTLLLNDLQKSSSVKRIFQTKNQSFFNIGELSQEKLQQSKGKRCLTPQRQKSLVGVKQLLNYQNTEADEGRESPTFKGLYKNKSQLKFQDDALQACEQLTTEIQFLSMNYDEKNDFKKLSPITRKKQYFNLIKTPKKEDPLFNLSYMNQSPNFNQTDKVNSKEFFQVLADQKLANYNHQLENAKIERNLYFQKLKNQIKKDSLNYQQYFQNQQNNQVNSEQKKFQTPQKTSLFTQVKERYQTQSKFEEIITNDIFGSANTQQTQNDKIKKHLNQSEATIKNYCSYQNEKQQNNFQQKMYSEFFPSSQINEQKIIQINNQISNNFYKNNSQTPKKIANIKFNKKIDY